MGSLGWILMCGIVYHMVQGFTEGRYPAGREWPMDRHVRFRARIIAGLILLPMFFLTFSQALWSAIVWGACYGYIVTRIKAWANGPGDATNRINSASS